MKNETFVMLALLAALAVCGDLCAGSFSADKATPTVDAQDIAQFKWDAPGGSHDVGKWWGGTQQPGQTFVTGDSPGKLRAVSLLCRPASRHANVKFRFVARVSKLAATNLTPIASEEIAVTEAVWPESTWLTFSFDTPVPLDANTEYAVDVEFDDGDAAWQDGLIYLCYQSTNLYAGGMRYCFDRGATTISTKYSDQDFAFHLDMAGASLNDAPAVQLIAR